MAKSSVKAEFDTSAINSCLDQLARMTGKDFKTVVDSEVEKILEQASKFTTAAKVASIRSDFANQEFSWIETGYETKRPFDGELMDGRKLYKLRNRYPNRLWNLIQAKRKQSLKNKLIARGLLKKSFVQIAESISLSVKAPAFVKNATTKRGDYPQDATARRVSSGASYSVHGRNARMYFPKSTFSALRRAINGRIRFFRTNLRMGVFDEASKIASKYPGISVTR